MLLPPAQAPSNGEWGDPNDWCQQVSRFAVCFVGMLQGTRGELSSANASERGLSGVCHRVPVAAGALRLLHVAPQEQLCCRARGEPKVCAEPGIWGTAAELGTV